MHSFTVQVPHLKLVLMADQEKFLHNPCVPYTSAPFWDLTFPLLPCLSLFFNIAAFMCANTLFMCEPLANMGETECHPWGI